MQPWLKLRARGNGVVAVLIATMSVGMAAARSGGAIEGNVLLAEWSGPYGGVPAFDRMALEDLGPALEAAMARKLDEISAISANPEPPTFENTLVAMERAGREFGRVSAYLGVWSGNLSTPGFRKIQAKMAPKLAEFRTRIIQNEALFRRIQAVHDGDEVRSLRPDQQRLVTLVHDRFVRRGAALEGDDRKRYGEINRRLAELHTRFADNVLADEEGHVTYISGEQLGGLPASLVEAAAAAASKRGRAGEYAIINTRSSMAPLLTFSDHRGLREKVWRTYYSRGDNGDAHDNNAVIAEILRLRHERAGLLGHDSYACWALEKRMARTPERVIGLMQAVWPAALDRVTQEVADMQAVADEEAAGIRIEAWDYRYYAEKVRRKKYDLDSQELKQYLQLEKLRDAMFFVAGKVFGMEFAPVPANSVPVFHEDVRVWEVTDKASGRLVGLWYLDPYARPGKRSGAWATSYRKHETFDGSKTVLASNNSNFVKAPPGKPVLISWDDARTLFHEFGHALHSLSSKVVYPGLNGGLRDFIEFQSQLLERWLLTDEVIDKFLVHHETGERMPASLVEKTKNAAKFNQGFATTEYLASALVDMKFHAADPAALDVDAFERAALAELRMPREIVMRHRSPQFAHIFSGEGYAAGYYSYMWAEVMTSDAAEAFAEAPGGFYDQALARKLVDGLFSPGNSVDPGDAYRRFRGRDAGIGALLRDRGFAAAGSRPGSR